MFIATVLALTAAASGAGIPNVPMVQSDTACPARNVPVQGRKSPLDSLTFTVSRQQVKVCYGRPASRGRVMLGGDAVPYGQLWRTGANEPTVIFTPVALTIAGVKVPAGQYSLYTVPGAKEWEIIVNRSTSQWGEESDYTDKVKAQEVGRGKVAVQPTTSPVESFTIRAEPARGAAKALMLEWEKTRVRIPIQPA
ncbi:MAG: DUF2911 domain-containing protein [Gemmatimonadales bacterium]|nr:DUF2911 domain-containing protein [Gemmatimonadales bacterium]